LKEILRQFVEKVVAERSRRTYSIDALKREYPFQSLFFRDEALVAFKHQRTIVTKLGQQLYPQLIVALAQTRYRYVKREFQMLIALDRSLGNAITVDDFVIPRPNDKSRGYLAFPYGLRETYRHNFTQRITDMKAEVLIGAELWDMIGGSGTFEELLAVIDEVRNEVPLL
jgi:hypothetical protein